MKNKKTLFLHSQLVWRNFWKERSRPISYSSTLSADVGMIRPIIILSYGTTDWNDQEAAFVLGLKPLWSAVWRHGRWDCWSSQSALPRGGFMLRSSKQTEVCKNTVSGVSLRASAEEDQHFLWIEFKLN